MPPQVELEIVKTAVGAFRVGTDGRYLIEVTNHGPTEDPGALVVTDVLPAGLEYRSAQSDRFSCVESSGTVECTLDGVLAVDETVSLTLVGALALALLSLLLGAGTVGWSRRRTA